MERRLGHGTLEDDARRLLTWVRTAAGGLTHNLLSATHTDTIAGAATRGNLIVGDSTPKWTGLALGTSGYVVGSDGTDVVYLNPATTVPLAPVAQGDLLVANGTPAWSILTLAGGAGYALVSTATTVAWDSTPTWTGDHAWDDGSGDSPAVKFIGGSNDDTISIFLEDSATAGNSDVVVKLCAADADSKFKINDSSDSTVAYIDAAGGLDIEGHSAIGATASMQSGVVLYVYEVQSAAESIGIDAFSIAQPSAGFSGSWRGIIGTARLDAAQEQSSGLFAGMYGKALIAGEVAGTVLSLIGGLFLTDAEDGTATAAHGVYAYTPYVDTGTVTTGYGVRILEGTVGGSGTMTTLYGLHIAAISAGATSYSIYTAGGNHYLGDDTEINGVLTLQQQSEPSDPSEGAGVLWVSNGTGAGDEGDLMWKTTESSVTKTETLIDFSEI